MGLVNYARLST